MPHPVQWTAPSPIWPALTSTADLTRRRSFNQPAILRFASDTFMEDFTGTLAIDPSRIGELLAQPETWRGPATTAAPTPLAPPFARALQRRRIAVDRRAAVGTSAAAATLAAASPATGVAMPPLKLYQPAHQRYYLVAASLVCQLPGLPDRTVDSGVQERTTFVLRRLLPRSGVTVPTADSATSDEYAFVQQGSGGAWQKVGPPQNVRTLVHGEDQQPLFPTTFVDDESRRRRVLAGLLPVGKRDVYIAAQEAPGTARAASPATATAPLDARVALLRKQVVEPWNQLTARARAVDAVLASAANETERGPMRADARGQIQTISWYVLLDLAKFLEAHTPGVWAALTGAPAALAPAEAALVTALGTTVFRRDGTARSLSAALVALRGQEQRLERVVQPYVEGSSAWPSELFPLASVPPAPASGTTESLTGLTPAELEARVAAALPATPAAPMPETPLAMRPVLAPADPGWFVVRCVYERPQCGPAAPPVISEASAVFQLAGFFDPDAPARPIRIALPMDVSPAGLRKFDKNTAFMMSDMLCGHFQRMRGLTLGDLVRSVLPFPLHKDLPGTAATPCADAGGGTLGLMVSLSIPIITICALMLLMIIVSLLDIVFRWMPFFVITFPLPGFKAKENG
jgi:hypothetical protein